MKGLYDEASARAVAVGWERQLKRVQIATLIREFKSTVSSPGGARHARNILKRTIEALEGFAASGNETYFTYFTGSVAHCVRLEWRAKAAILQELKALHQLWSATQTDAITPEFAHAMDSLLMHEVKFEEYLPTLELLLRVT